MKELSTIQGRLLAAKIARLFGDKEICIGQALWVLSEAKDLLLSTHAVTKENPIIDEVIREYEASLS